MPTPLCDYSKKPQDIIRDLIYASNGFMLPATGVLYGVPTSTTPLVADAYQRDTFVQLSIDPNAYPRRYRGSRTFLYKRIDLGTLNALTSASPTILVTSLPTDSYTLLSQINACYGLQLSQADVQNITYGSVVGAVLAAEPTSLAFQGNLALNLQLVNPVQG
jgi:hypothetical protein